MAGKKFSTQGGGMNRANTGKYMQAKSRQGNVRMNTGDLANTTAGIPVKAQRPKQAGPSKTPQALRMTPLVNGRPLLPGTDVRAHNSGGASRKSNG